MTFELFTLYFHEKWKINKSQFSQILNHSVCFDEKLQLLKKQQQDFEKKNQVPHQHFWWKISILILLHFLYSFWKKIRMIPLIFDIEKWPWNSEMCYFWTSILKRSEGLEFHYGRFYRSSAFLSTNKLRDSEKHNFMIRYPY